MDRTANRALRNRQLDGLRGYAAVMVAIFHAILGVDATQIERIVIPSLLTLESSYERATKFVLAIFNGEAAVVMFFIMSGAVLIASLRRDPAPPLQLTATFLVRRVLRIYPALIACLAIFTVFFLCLGRQDAFKLFWINLSLIEFPVIGPSWTLNVELSATPFILLGGFVLMRWAEWGLLVFVVAFLFSIKASFVTPYIPYFQGYAFCFALGMFVPTRWGGFVARMTHPWGWIVFLLLMLFSPHILIFGPKTTANIQQSSAALLVNALYYDVARGLGAALRVPVSQFFGRISYTFYLGNVLVLDMLARATSFLFGATARPLEAGLLSSVVVVGLGIPIAYALTIWVEEPGIRLSQRWSRRISSRAGSPFPARLEEA